MKFMESTLKRTWAVIDLDALKENYEKLRRHIGRGVKFLGVVKADAYGHGAIQVSRVLQENGADYLAVSSIDEAMELRLGGITMPILILGHTPKEQVENLIKNRITQAVTCKAKALEYSQEAQRCGGTLKIHIKVDTGMSRLATWSAATTLKAAWRVSARLAACRAWRQRAFSPISPCPMSRRMRRAGPTQNSSLTCSHPLSIRRRRSWDGSLPCATAPTPGPWPTGRR